MVPLAWASCARNMPVRLHDLTSPSSPQVASDVPSLLQRSAVTAPWWAGTDFSIRPVFEMSLKLPSVQPTTKRSDPLLPACTVGYHSRSVQQLSTSMSCACGSPSTFHCQIVLSSATLSRSLDPDHETPVANSLCFFVCQVLTLSCGIAPPHTAPNRLHQVGRRQPTNS
eukprot:scaffold8150_cov72-Phaeocystis_antarctica.AAC.5